MKFQKKQMLLFAVPIIIGLYLIFKPKVTKLPPLPKPKPQGDFEKYIVTTNSSNLNVRTEPSTNGEILTTIAKGTEIFARPFSDTGWSEYSKNGSEADGYVSSDFLTKK